MAQSLVFTDTSLPPAEAVSLRQVRIPEYGPTQLLVKMLAAPINPLDLAVLRGKYPVKPQNLIGNEMIPGSDGTARVIGVGETVGGFEIGDVVIIRCHCLGTWRTHAVLEASDVFKVPRNIDPCLASIFRMGIMPAYFQLRDYHPLHPGDWIIQNAATSTVAHFVCQFAQLWGVKVISVIRNRPDANAVKKSLQTNGANLVLTEEELGTAEALKGMKIVMAIDSVSGPISAKMASVLSSGSTFLTTGFLGADDNIHNIDYKKIGWAKDITFKALRLTKVLETRSTAQQEAMIAWFAESIQQGQLKPPLLECVRWESGDKDLEGRLKDAIGLFDAPIGRKKVLVFDG